MGEIRIERRAEAGRSVRSPEGTLQAAAGSPTAHITALCVLGILARLYVALRHPNVIHADETFQYLEQALRIVTGRGLIPWEYKVGIRSWVLPGLLVPVVWMWHALSSSPILLFVAVRLFGAALSLACVVAAYLLGRRAAGTGGALAAGALAALWPEIVIMSPHVMADTASAVPLMSGLAFGYRARPTRQELFWAGLLLAATVLLRPQLAPAIGMAGLWLANVRWDRCVPLAIGALVAILLFGLVDVGTLGAPFAWLPRYVILNKAGVASAFGEMRRLQYAVWEIKIWWVASPVILATAALGMRRLPLVGVVAIAILLTLSLVPHKEERFIYPAIPLVFTLCGVGTAAIVAWWRERGTRHAAAAWPVAASCWIAIAAMAYARPLLVARETDDEPLMRAFAMLARSPGLCGVGLAPAEDMWRTGLVYLRPGLSFYAYDPARYPRLAPYNSVLLIGGNGMLAPLPASPGEQPRCFEGAYRVCVVIRHAPCIAGVPLKLVTPAGAAAVLRRFGYR